MIYSFLADLLVVFHLVFILYVLFGALMFSSGLAHFGSTFRPAFGE